MKLGTRCLPLFLFPCLAPLLSPAAAQGGPWTDGELIVRTSSGGAPLLVRVEPESGTVTTLFTPLGWSGWSGSVAFDAYRGVVLANAGIVTDGTPRLWQIASDGSATAVPGLVGSLRALAPVGDGRVYFLRHFGSAQGPTTVEYLDATNTLRVLKAADGVTDFQIEVEHLLYDATSNALIGSSSPFWTQTRCGPFAASLYSIPLSADGSQVAGTVRCVSPAGSGASEDVMSLDHLPDGRVLVTIASGGVPSTSVLLALDPASLTTTVWADPSQGDIDGGVWSERLGRAVLHAAWSSGYRLYQLEEGDAGVGIELPTSQALPGDGGFSPHDTLIEVDQNGPACAGLQVPYGVGLAGTGGIVPRLALAGCPDVGATFTATATDVVGGAPGLLAIGLSPGAFPLVGGTLLLGSLDATFALAADGTAGAAGAGTALLPATLPPSLYGIDFYAQAAFLDPGAVRGIALTQGLRVRGY